VNRLTLAILLLLATCACSAQRIVSPAEDCRKTLTVNQFLLPDDAAAAKQSFVTFREALLNGNREKVISFVRFPADLVLNGSGVSFKTSQEFEGKYDQFFTPYVIRSVRRQKPDELVAGWEGIRLSNRAITLSPGEDGRYLVTDIRSHYQKLPEFIREYEDKQLTCKPVVIEGKVAAYDWVSHAFPGAEGIYADYLIVNVTKTLGGEIHQSTIRIDSWGERSSSDDSRYSLPKDLFKPGTVWRMYLRTAEEVPKNSGICDGPVQETISSVDEHGNEIRRDSAITVLDSEKSLTYAGLPCFEVHKEFLFLAN
jgi:hypothetical protein